MKPKIAKRERKALRFAYELALGLHPLPLPYVYRAQMANGAGALISVRPWIAPDQAADRPYLSEDVLSALEMKGYMEAAYHAPAGLWVFRLTREGCMAMGWDLPPLNERGIPKDPTRLYVESHRRPRQPQTPPRRLRRFSIRDLTPPDAKKRYRRR
jgi:hypothetical protein